MDDFYETEDYYIDTRGETCACFSIIFSAPNVNVDVEYACSDSVDFD